MTHYFETPTSEERRRTIDVRFWDTDWTFTTAAGVFSGDGLDLGTGVLLRTHTPDAGARRILDLGCGYGVLTVAAASLMTLVARHPDAGQLLAHPDAAAAGAAVGAFAYFFGTVLYVKTLIRERGNRAYLVASVGWHAVATLVAAAGASTGVARPWWALFFAATTVRAWVVPHLRSLPTPKQAGFGEIALCVALVGAFALT